MYDSRPQEKHRCLQGLTFFFCILVLLGFFHNYNFYSFISKMDLNPGAIIIGAEIMHSGADIIGANFFTWQAMWQVLVDRRHRSWRRPP
jgi:hypothetical protein